MSDRISKIASDSDLPSSDSGTLYVVATPIGNLADISHRALKVLGDVDLILAEDTRHSKRLLNHYGISTKLRSCHEHNEAELIDSVLKLLSTGQNLALISDAGTPLISDPGFVLVRALREQHCDICAVPGASSIIAALSIAGLATDSFVYDGFLPSKGAARRTSLEQYRDQHRTVVLLESSHRIASCLVDIVEVLGSHRRVVLARELTKKFETILDGPASELAEILNTDSDQTRGEFVLMLAGVEPAKQEDADLRPLLKLLMAELPLKQASGLAAKISNRRKNEIYELALKVKEEG